MSFKLVEYNDWNLNSNTNIKNSCYFLVQNDGTTISIYGWSVSENKYIGVLATMDTSNDVATINNISGAGNWDFDNPENTTNDTDSFLTWTVNAISSNDNGNWTNGANNSLSLPRIEVMSTSTIPQAALGSTVIRRTNPTTDPGHGDTILAIFLGEYGVPFGLNPLKPFERPCFSYNTLLEIVRLQKAVNPTQKLYLMSKTRRNAKKMYRCNYENHENLEFTSDHQFLYENKLVDFENIVNVHPHIKNSAKEIPLDDKTCGSNSMIYNIYGHFERLHKKNQFKLGSNLTMLGGIITNDKEAYNKVEEKINLLETEMKSNDALSEKFSFTKFIDNKNIDSNKLYIVAV